MASITTSYDDSMAEHLANGVERIHRRVWTTAEPDRRPCGGDQGRRLRRSGWPDATRRLVRALCRGVATRGVRYVCWKDWYTGGLIESNPWDGVPGHAGFAYTYGYVEWEVYVPGVSPKGLGCPKNGCLPDWPGVWSIANTNGNEIDTMEGLETLGKACYHLHPPPGSAGPGACRSASYADWHTYGSEWEPGVVTYFYDGAQVGQISTEAVNTTPSIPDRRHAASRLLQPAVGRAGRNGR